ncbi:MAG: iron ABC transporter permease, partial [Synergistaceae bacterium]|nr:iron ABC transporter permease [Synergistaceae bacterium]
MAPKPNSSAYSKGAFLPDASSVLYALLAGGVLVFILWPTLAILKESVLVDGAFSLERYGDLLTGNRTLLKNSLFVGWWTTVLAVLIGLCCALYVTRTSFRGKRAVLGVLLLTLISPPFVSSLSYIMLFGRRGLVTWRLLGLRWSPYGAHGIVLMESVGLAAVAAFLIMAVLRGIDRSLEQASFDLGAGRWETLLRVTLPLARPGIVTAALIVFIRSLSDFGTPMFIGGNYNVLATQAYMTAVGSNDLPKAAAISTLLVVPAFFVFLVYRKLMAGAPLFSSKSVASGEERSLPGAVRWFVFAVVWSFVLFEAMKYGAIFCGAFVRTWGVDFSFTLHHLKTLQ